VLWKLSLLKKNIKKEKGNGSVGYIAKLLNKKFVIIAIINYLKQFNSVRFYAKLRL